MSLVIVILYLLRNLKTGLKGDVSRESIEQVIKIVEPIIIETKATAKQKELPDLVKEEVKRNGYQIDG